MIFGLNLSIVYASLKMTTSQRMILLSRPGTNSLNQ
jgi:hypothetical protein